MVFNEKVTISLKLNDLTMEYEDLRNYLNSYLETNPTSVVLDFSQIEVISSVALGTLVGFTNRVRGLGIAVEAINVSPRLKQILRLVSLDRVFGSL
ncbi:anti-sigma factor antagonist [Leptospira yasudae]|uniref:Anti-sigma factor antagonist n=2 Tax=Leptospira yasudae TaxID=2202201 RepID=A0A6N4R1B6_9LEPT|nr:anti-sigma factor antagonist [Leptospira yasudae]RHX94269.1 anti-sigma factor antagonist [Leptospira yasudae]TGL82139.1 anti-sigma factor antagonist [Leptospira yasudae]TGL83252.1 anti-sigma factor antagonist [Leptospira yasudae]TGL87497.1 anti-sigma factor antagonist [Leptospira yasudae]